MIEIKRETDSDRYKFEIIVSIHGSEGKRQLPIIT